MPAAGGRLRACILVRAKSGRAKQVADRLTKMEGVTRAFPVFGAVDVIARAQVASLEKLVRLVSRIDHAPDVLGSETLPELEVE